MPKKVLIIDDYDDLSTALRERFESEGHRVETAEERDDAIDLLEEKQFDVIITDLDGRHLPGKNETPAPEDKQCLPDAVPESERSHIKAFKICFANYKQSAFNEEELKNIVSTTLNYKLKHIDRFKDVQNRREKIEFEIPSVIGLMHDILDYLMKRVEKNGVVNPENSNLFIALDEAFVNAVKHGNKFDAEKLVRITAEVSNEEARFSIEDEGEGFNVAEIPDPTNPENLFKESGRGVFFIYNIMDEVFYNERGNRLTMVKRCDRREPQNSEVS